MDVFDKDESYRPIYRIKTLRKWDIDLIAIGYYYKLYPTYNKKQPVSIRTLIIYDPFLSGYSTCLRKPPINRFKH